MAYNFTRYGDFLKIMVEQDAPYKDLEDAARKIPELTETKKISLDLKNCYYIQSKALAAMIAMKKNAAKIGAEFSVTNVCDNVYQVMEMANLSSYFTIEEDFSSYTPDELMEKFFQPDYADRVSDFIASSYSDEFRRKLLEILEMQEPELKFYAVLTMGKAHDYSAEEKIKQELSSDVPLVVKAAVLVLGWFGDTASKEKIYEVLESGAEEVTEAAAASIALLSDESDAARLGKLLSSPSKTIRTAAIQALTLINDDTCFELLKNSLETESDDDVKAMLIRAVSSFNRGGVSDILIKWLDSKSIKIREASASGLAKIKAKDKLEDIISRITDNDAWVGYFAVKACGEICSASEAGRLMESYDMVDENVKLAIVEALGKIPGDFSDFYMSILDNGNEDIRKEVLISLFNDNRAYALPAASNLFVNDSSWLVRYKALEILEQIRPEGFKDLLRTRLVAEDNKYVKDKIQSVLEVL
ncbi:HEAT repeat domain-containing protein [Seleniivibrio woodruffii]|uniref:HEAT repeat domain-containing protein n=1 Tax=Seleniivibrio woodruffii TaxID=1078050 RepID=UPI00240A4776|nr:HEAT repeat domain-containing protein [Seleniivibrio woodruffii]